MRERVATVVTTWPFLFAVTALLLNDWWLKQAFPGVVSGKLSDFAGVAIAALVFFASYPRRAYVGYVAISLAFLWWKSPGSTALIELINDTAPFHIGRVVDYSDLLALMVLPLCKHVSKLPSRYAVGRWAVRAVLVGPVYVVTALALVGTSVVPTRQDYGVRPMTEGVELSSEEVAKAISLIVEQHGLQCEECSKPLETATFSGDGLALTYRFHAKNSVTFEIEAYPNGLFFGASGEEKADALRASLKSMFAEKFKGLEYFEPLRSAYEGYESK
jgi:hypothetical protein